MTKEQREKFEKQIAQEKRIAELEETIKRLQKQILEFTRELHSSNKENAELKEKYNELSKAVFELKGEFMACPLDDTNKLGELIDRLNNL